MKYRGKQHKRFHEGQKKPGHRKNQRSPKPDHELIFKANANRKAFANDLTAIGAQRITNTQNQEIFLLTAKVEGAEKTITLQQKSAFGGLGNDVIQVRSHNRQLISTSDWIIAFDEFGIGKAFPTHKLKEYLSQCWGTVSRRATTQKRGTLALPIRLEDFFTHMKIKPIKVVLGKDHILEGIEQIKAKTFPSLKTNPLWRKRKLRQAKPTKTYGWGAPTAKQQKRIATQFGHPQFLTASQQRDRRGLIQNRSSGLMRRGR